MDCIKLLWGISKIMHKRAQPYYYLNPYVFAIIIIIITLVVLTLNGGDRYYKQVCIGRKINLLKWSVEEGRRGHKAGWRSDFFEVDLKSEQGFWVGTDGDLHSRTGTGWLSTGLRQHTQDLEFKILWNLGNLCWWWDGTSFQCWACWPYTVKLGLEFHVYSTGSGGHTLEIQTVVASQKNSEVWGPWRASFIIYF